MTGLTISRFILSIAKGARLFSHAAFKMNALLDGEEGVSIIFCCCYLEVWRWWTYWCIKTCKKKRGSQRVTYRLFPPIINTLIWLQDYWARLIWTRLSVFSYGIWYKVHPKAYLSLFLSKIRKNRSCFGSTSSILCCCRIQLVGRLIDW